MGDGDEARVLGVLLGLAALLYLVSWLVAGPPAGPASRDAPDHRPTTADAILPPRP